MLKKLVGSIVAGACILFASISAPLAFAQTPPVQMEWVFFPPGNLTTRPYASELSLIVAMDQSGSPALMFQRWEMSGNRLRAIVFVGDGCSLTPNLPECTFATRPRSSLTTTLPPLPPGNYILEVTNNDGQITKPDLQTRTLSVSATPPTLTVTTVGFRPKSKFFLSASDTEVAALTATARYDGPLWAIAEPITLRAWPAAGPAPDAAKEVCRLFHPMAQTHFFSGNATDCAAIRSTAPWRDDGIAFRALLPAAGGVCPIGTEPVWRLFSSKFTTHRYTRSSTTYAAFQADGWSGEGVVFCSAPA